jgi:hypothetical protein
MPCKMMAGYSLKENQYKVLKIHSLQKNKESQKRGITLISRSKNKVHQVLQVAHLQIIRLPSNLKI